MTSDKRPLLALTMGDPAGIGPETIAGAWPDPAVHACCRPVVVGHAEVLRRAVTLRRTHALVQEITSVDQADPSPTRIPCLTVCADDVLDVSPGHIDARGGEAAYRALLSAAELAIAGKIDGLTTAPLHKAALWLAGHQYPGHTELLAELCGIDDFAMMLYLAPGAAPGAAAGEHVRSPAPLAIVHVTLHMALRDVFAAIDTNAVLFKTRLIDQVMTRLSGSRPRIGVCALNPHAGEEGLFGDEEVRIIRPAVEFGRAEGLIVDGPIPADTLIARARDGQFDAVVAMYHDQGHIAIKLLAMHRAVNVTLGLPIVRTSVAHGTAFDLAWQGRAETSGMVEAIRVASRLARVK
jgi:4-hydroxythreonine-4-phosphate dehydrogenase